MSRNKELPDKSVLEKIRNQIQNLSREPFRDALADAMHARPTIEQLQEFSAKSPDRWAQLVSILGKLSEYSEDKKITHEHNFLLKIQDMPDSELEVEFERMKRSFIEGEFTQIVNDDAQIVNSGGDGNDSAQSESPVEDGGSTPPTSTLPNEEKDGTIS